MRYFLLIIVMFGIVISDVNSQIQWNQVRQNSEKLLKVECADNLNCFCLGELKRYKRILKSVDGGLTWLNEYDDQNIPGKPIPLTAHSLSFPVFDKIFIGSNDGIILKSQNSLENFDTLRLNQKDGTNYQSIRDLKMCDSVNGIAGSSSYIFKTNDGWKTYEDISLDKSMIPNEYNIIYGENMENFLYIFDHQTYLVYFDFYKIVGDLKFIFNSKIAKTTNGGNDWLFFELCNTTDPSQERIGINSFYFHDKLDGWALAFKAEGSSKKHIPLLLKTTNGGLNWSEQNIQGIQDYILTKIVFRDKNKGLLIGKNGAFFTTYDGGISWNNESAIDSITKLNRESQDIAIAGNNTILITSNDGIYHTDNLTTVFSNNYSNNIIYPNPASDYIEISTDRWTPTSGWNPSEKVQIFNTLGVEVITTPSASQPPLNEGNLRIDVSKLPSGVYFVRIIGSNGACSIVEKFVKM